MAISETDENTVIQRIRHMMSAFNISLSELGSQMTKLDGSGPISKAHLFDILSENHCKIGSYLDQFPEAFNSVLKKRGLCIQISLKDLSDVSNLSISVDQ